MLTKTKIEWVKNPDGTRGYIANPIKGLCPVACPYCYARGFYKRFKWDTRLRFEPKVLQDIEKEKLPRGIFMCSTMELFHPKIKMQWLDKILFTLEQCLQHRFYILTKIPNRADYAFPKNVWFGITMDNSDQLWRADVLRFQVNSKIKFISFEPLLGRFYNILYLANFDWIIIGAQTGANKVKPQKEWVEKIIEQADEYKIPVFLKNNLDPYLKQWGMKKRQEMPE